MPSALLVLRPRSGNPVPLPPTYADIILGDGPSHYWQLNESGGLVTVDQVGGLHGTISGGVTLAQPGPLSDGTTSMTFDGNTGQISTTVTGTLGVLLSVEGWVNVAPSVTGDLRWFSSRVTGATGDQVAIGVMTSASSGGMVAFVLPDFTSSGPVGTRRINDGAWHYVVATFDGISATIFVDGVLDTRTALARLTPSVGLLALGWDPKATIPPPPQPHWKGGLDEVAIYPYVLTDAQIKAHYAARLPASLPVVPPVNQSYIVSELLTAALKRINVVQAGQVATGDDLRDAFRFANVWLDSMANERLMIPFVQRTTFPIMAGKGAPTDPYTVGLGGDISIPKPVFLDKLNYVDTAIPGGNEIPLFMLTDQAYQGLVAKTLTSTYPVYGYYSATYAAGLGSLYLHPIPTANTSIGVLYSPSALQQFTSLTQALILPPGYLFFLQENLAVFFASTFRENLPTDPGLIASARATKRNIKAMNVPMVDLAIDQGALFGHGYKSNIFTGQ